LCDIFLSRESWSDDIVLAQVARHGERIDQRSVYIERNRSPHIHSQRAKGSVPKHFKSLGDACKDLSQKVSLKTKEGDQPLIASPMASRMMSTTRPGAEFSDSHLTDASLGIGRPGPSESCHSYSKHTEIPAKHYRAFVLPGGKRSASD
jgi:hypothetical protein